MLPLSVAVLRGACGQTTVSEVIYETLLAADRIVITVTVLASAGLGEEQIVASKMTASRHKCNCARTTHPNYEPVLSFQPLSSDPI